MQFHIVLDLPVSSWIDRCFKWTCAHFIHPAEGDLSPHIFSHPQTLLCPSFPLPHFHSLILSCFPVAVVLDLISYCLPQSLLFFVSFVVNTGVDSARVRQVGQIAGQSSTRRLGDYRVKFNYNEIDLLRWSQNTFIIKCYQQCFKFPTLQQWVHVCADVIF